MKQLAQCVVRYAQCLWEAQPLLLPRQANAAPMQQRAAALTNLYLASLLATLAVLPADQRATLTLAGRMGLRPVLASQHRPDPVRDALLSGDALVPPHPVDVQAAPWRDATLAAVVLRSLQYALDLTDALPDPHATMPMTGLSGEQHAALWSAAHAVEDQQAALWDAAEAVSADEAGLLAESADEALRDLAPGSPHHALLAYFASGMFAQRVLARG